MEVVTTKLTIQDIIDAAKSAGIKCENCSNFKISETIGEDVGICSTLGYILKDSKNIRLEHKNGFCSKFKPKINE
mgnify:CR=1 FL=1